jgi:hypothetical protein
MNEYLNPGFLYKSDDTIEINKSSMDKILWKAETALGLPHKSYSYSIDYDDECGLYKKLQVAKLDVSRNCFIVPRIQHESAPFHEAIHYLMHLEELLFKGSSDNDGSYGEFVDETVAYLGTAQVFGYADWVNHHIKDMSENVDDYVFLSLVQNHVVLEEKYLKTRDIYDILPDTKKCFKQSKKIFSNLDIDVNAKFDIYTYFVQSLAMKNSMELLDNNFNVKDLRLSIHDSVKDGLTAFEIYFKDVIGNKSAI